MDSIGFIKVALEVHAYTFLFSAPIGSKIVKTFENKGLTFSKNTWPIILQSQNKIKNMKSKSKKSFALLKMFIQLFYIDTVI